MKLILSLLMIGTSSFSIVATAGDLNSPAQPKSPCEALAVQKSRVVAQAAASGGAVEVTAINYIGANREFNIEFSNANESVVVSVNVTSGSHDSECTLNSPYVLENN